MRQTQKRYYCFQVLMAAIFLSSGLQAMESPFEVTVQGKRAEIQYIQKRSELKMARSTDYCRGYLIPIKVEKWSCKLGAQGQFTCQTKYLCKHVRRGMNRRTETRRISSELKKISHGKGSSFKIVVGKIPYSKARALEQKKLADLKAAKLALKNNPTVKRKKEKLNLDELKEFENLEQSEIATNKKEMNKNIKEVLSPDEMEKEQKKKEEEGDWIFSKEESTSGEETYKIRKKTQDKEGRGIGRGHWLSFAAFLTKISDANSYSLTSTEGAWTPYGRFGESIGWRGHFGGKYLETQEVLGVSESFLVMDGALFLQWFVGNSLFLEGGVGIQKWGGTIGGSYTTSSLGLGYRFENYLLKIIDGLVFDYTAVGNDNKNIEMKFGVNFSF